MALITGHGTLGARSAHKAPARTGGLNRSQIRLLDPQQPLTGTRLLQAARALTDLQTRPQLDALARQITLNDQLGGQVQDRTMDYYRQLATEAAGGLAASQAIGSRLNGDLAGIGQNTQNTISQAGNQAQQALAQSNSTGLGGDSASQLAAEIAAQRGNAAQGAQAFQSYGATQGANYGQLGASGLQTGAMRGIENLGNLASQFAATHQKLAGQQSTIEQQRPALLEQEIGKLRDSEFNKIATGQTLGLKEATLQQTAADKAASRQVTLHGQTLSHQDRVAKQQADAQAKKDATSLSRAQFIAKYGHSPEYVASHPGVVKPSGKKPTVGLGSLTSNEENKLVGQVGEAQSWVKRLSAQGKTPDQIQQLLQTGLSATSSTGASVHIPKFDKRLISAAIDLNSVGALTPASVKALHSLGIHINNAGFPVQSAKAIRGGKTKVNGQGIAGVLGL